MKVITVTNRKGGVGKTTISATLAAGLARSGFSVLLIDTDPQGNLSSWFGGRESRDLFNLLYDDHAWNQVTVRVPVEKWVPHDESGGDILIVRSDEMTKAAEMLVKSSNRLRMRLAEIEGQIDYVVIDTAPSMSQLQKQAYRAADYILIPAMMDVDSFSGVETVLSEVRAASEEYGQPIKLLGIVPTQFDSRTIQDQKGLEYIQTLYGDAVMTPLRSLVAWKESRTSGESIFSYSGGDRAVQDATAFISEIERKLRNGQ